MLKYILKAKFSVRIRTDHDCYLHSWQDLLSMGFQQTKKHWLKQLLQPQWIINYAGPHPKYM